MQKDGLFDPYLPLLSKISIIEIIQAKKELKWIKQGLNQD